MDKFDSISLFKENNKKRCKQNTPSTYFLQEKLDGCNFRVFCKMDTTLMPGEKHMDIEYGSRCKLLGRDEDFVGFRRIEKDIESCTRHLADITGFNTFTVYGELIGKTRRGKLILPRIDYDLGEGNESIGFFAFEISKEGEFLPFKMSQELLNASGFLTIPIQEYFGMFSPRDHPFESIYFNHQDETRTEGYIVRFCDEDGHIVRRFKVKTPHFVGQECGSQEVETFDVVSDENLDRAFLDFISKHNFMDDEKFKVRKDRIKECIDAFVDEFAEDNGDHWKKTPKKIIAFVYRKYVEK